MSEPNPIIERAARELAQQAEKYRPHNTAPAMIPPEPELDWEAFVPQVQAVLRATREPSEAMVQAGDVADYECTEGISMLQLGIDPAIVWQAMIDAALGDE